jgi:hypothetical protein
MFSAPLVQQFLDVCKVTNPDLKAEYDRGTIFILWQEKFGLVLNCMGDYFTSGLASYLARSLAIPANQNLLARAIECLDIPALGISVRGRLITQIENSRIQRKYIVESTQRKRILTIEETVKIGNSIYAKQNSQIIQAIAELYGSTVSIYSTDKERGYPLLYLFPGFGIEKRMNRPMDRLLHQPVLESIGLIGTSKQRCIEETIASSLDENQIDLNLNNYNKVHYSIADLCETTIPIWEKDLVGLPVKENEVMILTLDSEINQIDYWKKYLENLL